MTLLLPVARPAVEAFSPTPPGQQADGPARKEPAGPNDRTAGTARPVSTSAGGWVLDGPERFELPLRTVYLGRAKENDFTVEDPTVSGRHASLSPGNEAVTVHDLASRNGTFLNGVVVPRHTPTLAGHGDRLLFGSREYRLLRLSHG